MEIVLECGVVRSLEKGRWDEGESMGGGKLGEPWAEPLFCFEFRLRLECLCAFGDDLRGYLAAWARNVCEYALACVSVCV